MPGVRSYERAAFSVDLRYTRAIQTHVSRATDPVAEREQAPSVFNGERTGVANAGQELFLV